MSVSFSLRHIIKFENLVFLIAFFNLLISGYLKFQLPKIIKIQLLIKLPYRHDCAIRFI